MDRMVIAGKLKFYHDLLADVRKDETYHPIRALVQVDDPEVREIARVLVQADDFVQATHEFVNSFTSYRREIGDYWTEPWEMLSARAGDCDDSSILLCSLLRNYIPPEKVFVAIGLWTQDGRPDGHAWVIVQDEDGTDMVLESTAHPLKSLRGKYTLSMMFNDQYAFATDIGLKDFDLRTVEEKEVSYAESRS